MIVSTRSTINRRGILSRNKLICAVCLTISLTVEIFAQGGGRQVLHDRLQRVTSRLQPVGRLPGDQRLGLVLGLQLRNSEAFTNLLDQIYSPASTNYHHYLTPRQIGEKFGPTEESYQKVIQFADANGLKVTGTYPDHTAVRVEGAVSNIERAFHVTMRVYQHPVEARTFYANDTAPSADLDVPLAGIDGLNNYTVPHPMIRQIRPADSLPPANAAPLEGSGTNGSFIGYDFREAYAPGLALDGAGQTIAIFELDGYRSNDIVAYEQAAGLPNVPLSNILIDGFSGAAGNDSGEVEAELDIEMAISMAPGVSKILVYEGTNSPSPGWVYESYSILKQIQLDDAANQVSASWGLGSFVENFDGLYQEMAMQGQSFFLASGDYGAYYNQPQDVPEWADTPYVTIVGGTELTTSNSSWVSEQAWFGSGGGLSVFDGYPLPAWQVGIATAANQASTTLRNIPDVAMVADNIFVIASNNWQVVVAGTSCSTPLWAGFNALVNEQAAGSGYAPVGFINPALYAIGKGNYSTYTACLHDITSGNNGNCCAQFFAEPGYDLCTGWGSPNGQALINALMPDGTGTWVDFNYTGSTQNGTYANPFETLGHGLNAVSSGGTIWIRSPGSTAEKPRLSSPVTIRAFAGPAVIGQ